MQQYVLTLEAERNELQRGLDKQMALVRKLADEQMHADGAIEGAKRDVVRLQEELQQALADLATQVRPSDSRCWLTRRSPPCAALRCPEYQ